MVVLADTGSGVRYRVFQRQSRAKQQKMRGKIIAIGVLVVIAAVIVYFMFASPATDNSTANKTTPSGGNSDEGSTTGTPKTVTVTQLTWQPGDPIPAGYVEVTDSRTGTKNIRPISSR